MAKMLESRSENLDPRSHNPYVRGSSPLTATKTLTINDLNCLGYGGKTVAQIFREKVVIPESPDACWGWKFTKKSSRRPSRPSVCGIPAVKISWLIAGKPIRRGFYLCYKCDNPECTNPRHIFLGTPAQNSRDMVSKGRHWRQAGRRTA